MLHAQMQTERRADLLSKFVFIYCVPRRSSGSIAAQAICSAPLQYYVCARLVLVENLQNSALG
jgi:hypothetical protein